MSDNKKEHDCTRCRGKGRITERRSRQVPDFATGTAIGVALGMGYFPSSKTEYYDEDRTCPSCNGSGKAR